MKEIQLTKGKVAIVDDCDAHLAQWKWFCNEHGYAVRNSPYLNGTRTTVYLHHAVIGRSIKGLETDHRNGVRNDNRRENLHFVTHRENGSNRKEHRGEKEAKSSILGVHKETHANSWYATISIKGKQFRLGSFKTPEQAREVYEKRRKELVLSGL